MLGGPKSGLAAPTATPAEAAAFAAASTFRVIETVIFGLMTWIRIDDMDSHCRT
jgi:hypothetical protein